ncbi:permease-like cell division protein FtsX [Clostridium tarantellae]|uniref:permease-like cell division protein FtsX n=1 Tax=Clostridium tarantellae TaxID=39493 RepID=UPI001478D9B7|nr:permease-like cell division protein FtsX [Clostridium tarantellae]
MKIVTIKDLIKDGAKNIFTNRLVSFVAITTVFISLTLFGLFYSAVSVINENVKNLEEQVEIIAFLNSDVDYTRMVELKEEIEKLPNVESVNYISSDEGLNDYKDSFKHDNDHEMQRILNEVVAEGENPIPASLAIKTSSISANEEIKEQILSNKEFYKVTDGNIVTEFLSKLNKYTKIIGSILLIILAVASTLLISNAIKVAVFVRKKEISIIKYIGATNNYVRLPFIIEGLLIGTIGALLSVGVISLVYSSLSPSIISTASTLMNGFTLPALGNLLVFLIPSSIIIGAGIGIVGSLVSLRKYLKV